MVDTISNVQMTDSHTKVYFSWQDLTACINTISETINKAFIKPDFIYGLPRGGLIPATMLSYKLNIPLLTDLTHLTKLDNVLIVDDIADSGETLKELLKDMRAYGIYTIFYKLESIIEPTWYSSLAYPKEWIVFPWEE